MSQDGLELSCKGRNYVFPRSSIQSLHRHGGIFSVGLRIEHRVQSAPEFIVFWTFGFGRLKLKLKNLGYEVED